jgi:hypothetical protein
MISTQNSAWLVTQYLARFGQRTPRRWGWGIPLKKRTAARIKWILENQPHDSIAKVHIDFLLV